jgi:serine/threonine protein phosphatase PrpC
VTAPGPTPSGSTPSGSASSGSASSGSASSGSVGVVACPACGEEALPGEAYCENCGASLDGSGAGGGAPADPAAAAAGPGAAGASGAADAPALKRTDDDDDELPPGPPEGVPAEDALRSSTCAQCGGAIAADGYCAECGAPAVKQRDHWEESPAAWLGGVTDRGVRHHRNEDAMALAAGPHPGDLGVLVVCDGVSSSTDSDVASLAAARAARDVLAAPQADSPSPAGRIHGWTRRMTVATDAANDQAVAVARTRAATGATSDKLSSPPSCTFVAAVVDGPLVVAGWVGDSRAYWLPDGAEPRQLSADDSWAAEQISLGMPRDEAESAPLGHAITRWLGIDSPNHEPRCAALQPESAGWVLLCSDGLWNYASTPEALGRAFADAVAFPDAAGPDPTRISARLVAWANEQGGRDNITVALARVAAGAATTT